MVRLLKAQRRHQSGLDQDGFALIATLAVLALSSFIIMGLLAYTMVTVTYAAGQSLRDEQIQAGDGALEAMVNQLTHDKRGKLGTLSSPCTPDLQNHTFAGQNPDDGKFDYTIGGIPIEVECLPREPNGDPPALPEADVADVVNIVGDSYTGVQTRAVTCASESTFVCPEWNEGLTAAGLTGATAEAVDASGPTLTHSGPNPLWFTANQVRVSKGAAAVRTPITCQSSDTTCTPGALVGPALGVTGTYVQGNAGLFKDPSATSPNGKSCGVMQEKSTLPSAQVITTTANRTVCSDSVVGALSYSSGGNVVPDAPTDGSGLVIGSPEWVRIHRVTHLADTGGSAAGSTKGAAFSSFVNPDGSVKKCRPFSSGRRIDLLPGAYTRDVTAILSKWMSGQPYCNAVKYWFKPGYYWFDMNDSDPSNPNPFQLNFSDSKSYFIFGTPTRMDGVQNTGPTTFPLCDATKAGVSITLSQRTSIRHTKGRVGICGIKNKAAIYQSSSANLGWHSEAKKAVVGVTRRVARPSESFPAMFRGAAGNPGIPASSVETTFGSTGHSAVLDCDEDAGLFDQIYERCLSQTLATIGPGSQWWKAASPGHTPISNATVQVKALSAARTGDSFSPEASTSIGVFLAGNTTNYPDCGVYYKGVPWNETISYDLFDTSKATTDPKFPSCRSKIGYADELYNATIGISMISQLECESGFLTVDCGDFGPTLQAISLTTGWNPSGTKLTCVGPEVTPRGAASVTCKGKDGSTAGLRRSSSVEVVTGSNQAQLRVNCAGDEPVWATEPCGEGVASARFSYAIDDYTAPDYASLSSAASASPARRLQSLSVLVKGTSYCKRNSVIRANNCGPQVNSAGEDGVGQVDQDQVSANNSNNMTSFKNWGLLGSGDGSGAVVSITKADSAAATCTVSTSLPEHDETKAITIPFDTPGCSIVNSSQLVGAKVNVEIKVARRSDTDQYKCSNYILFGTNCYEWGYYLDWVGVTAASASATPAADYVGPPNATRITQYKSDYNNNDDALFNVYGQVVLPRADLDVAWNGPSTGFPMIEGPAPSGQPTLVVKSIASVTKKPLPASATPESLARRSPAVGVLCCRQYKQDVRRVVLIARLTDAATNNPGGLVGIATVEVKDKPQKKVTIIDWRLCNRTSSQSACDT